MFLLIFWPLGEYIGSKSFPITYLADNSALPKTVHDSSGFPFGDIQQPTQTGSVHRLRKLGREELKQVRGMAEDYLTLNLSESDIQDGHLFARSFPHGDRPR
jgi:hypothetical protein